MTNHDALRILHEITLHEQHLFDMESLRTVEINNRSYSVDEIDEFKRDLIEAGSKIRIMFLDYHLKPDSFLSFVQAEHHQILAFGRNGEDLVPILIQKKGSNINIIRVGENGLTQLSLNDLNSGSLFPGGNRIDFLVAMPYDTLGEEIDRDERGRKEGMSPVRRLIRLLGTEKKEIFYILFYAVLIGLLGLALPLGIQVTVELISGGVVFSSVYLMIGLVIVGVVVGGALQIMQLSLVEYLQRRLFAKASFEFAIRIPRIRMESIMGSHAPELVNRFFDVMTLQKGLPKLLIDLSSGTIQILFGLLLLSLYHPFFIFFSLILLAVLGIIFFMTGPRGLHSSIMESKYKYQVAHWLEELARTIQSFKLAGNSDLPVRRTDTNVTNYLKHRKTHFSVLVTQFSFIVLFKAAVTGGMLIVGTMLVVGREITLGQFVASEVVIILILNAVEKIIMYMDVIYDLLTAIDKVSHITDIPLERSGGVDFPGHMPRGYNVNLHRLTYRYESSSNAILKDITLNIRSGERICLSGPGGSGKSTLANILCGMYQQFEGTVTINQYSLRDLDLTHLRNKIGKNFSGEDIFDGSVLENVTMGKSTETVEDAMEALSWAGILDTVNRMPDGLQTRLISGGKGLPASFANRLILARCIAKHPDLMIINDYFGGLSKADRIQLISSLVNRNNPWTLVMISNDPLVMSQCDRVLILHEGGIVADGTYNELSTNGTIANYLD